MTTTDTTARDRAYGALCAMVLEDERRWGETAVQYQRDNALDILDVDAVIRQSWIELPRGARKTTDLAGILLALLVVQAPPMARLYVGAASEDQAQELIDAASGLIARTPELVGMFKVLELEITNVYSGASMRALPADASAMGKRAWLIVLDEVANWAETKKAKRFWDVLTSGNRKIAECRTVVITNAGTPQHWAWKRRETARTSENWRFCSIPGPLPWLTAADLQVLRENATLPSVFERLHMNRWVEAEDQLVSGADLDASMAPFVVPDGLRLSFPGSTSPVTVVGVDLGTKRDASVVAVGHLVSLFDAQTLVLSATRVVVDELRVWTGSPDAPVPLGEVEEYLLDVHRRLRPRRVLVDPHQAISIMQRLKPRGVPVEEFTFTGVSVGHLASTLFNLLRDRRIGLPVDAELREELSHVRLRENSLGVIRMDHDSGRHDDRAVAIALCAKGLLEVTPSGSTLPGASNTYSDWDSSEELSIFGVGPDMSDWAPKGLGSRW